MFSGSEVLKLEARGSKLEGFGSEFMGSAPYLNFGRQGGSDNMY
jgi:hypothetical protein